MNLLPVRRRQPGHLHVVKIGGRLAMSAAKTIAAVDPEQPSEGTVGASDGNAPSKAETDPSGHATTPSPGEKDSDSKGSGTSTDPSHRQPESVASYTQPGGGPVNPPTKPGDGRATTRATSATRPQDRLLSYVVPHRDRDQESTGDEPEDPTDDEQHRNLAIGQAAVERVRQYEKARGWTPASKKPHNNPGYDIESKSPSGEVRYIEVKGVDGPWDKAGVPGLTHPVRVRAEPQGGVLALRGRIRAR